MKELKKWLDDVTNHEGWSVTVPKLILVEGEVQSSRHTKGDSCSYASYNQAQFYILYSTPTGGIGIVNIQVQSRVLEPTGQNIFSTSGFLRISSPTVL